MPAAKLFISSLKKIEGEKIIPSKVYSLNTNDIIIYSIYLPNFINLKDDLVQLLNYKELEKANRFHKDIDKNRFIIYRSILKFILAAYTKLDVKDIYFNYQSNKKPYLASHPWLCFNISHSEDFAVIAISINPVGIDIEYISKDFDFSEMIQEVFNHPEILAISCALEQKNAFFNLWTRKEAFVKALGKGIDDDFKNIPCLDGQHTINSNLLNTTKNWKVLSFELTDKYCGAVAFEEVSKTSKNIVFHTMPNTMKELLKLL